MKRKITALLVMICMIVTMIPTAAAEETKPILSEMSDADLLAFLDENGVELPQRLYSDPAKVLQYARETIAEIEENPVIRYNFGNSELQRFSTEAQTAVNTYYGVDSIQIPAIIAATAQSLLYSTFRNMVDFNCYSYATDNCAIWKDPGSYCNSNLCIGDLSVAQLANLIVKDMKSSPNGTTHPCVYRTASRPSSVNAIAVRKNADNPTDYHVMRLFSSSNTWRHKPGTTAILTLDGLPNNTTWTNEGVDHTGSVVGGDEIYSGTIYYIVFKSTHNTGTKVYTGDHYHSGSYHYYEYTQTCPSCGVMYVTSVWERVSCSGNCSSINAEIEEGFNQ